MAKRNKDEELDFLLMDWITVDPRESPTEFEAWMRWRRENLGVISEPKCLTVPSPFPPTTIVAAKDYAEMVQKIRRSIGWNDVRARINMGRISAYMG